MHCLCTAESARVSRLSDSESFTLDRELKWSQNMNYFKRVDSWISASVSTVRLRIRASESTVQLRISASESTVRLRISTSESTVQLRISASESTVRLRIRARESTVRLRIRARESTVRLRISASESTVRLRIIHSGLRTKMIPKHEILQKSWFLNQREWVDSESFTLDCELKWSQNMKYFKRVDSRISASESTVRLRISASESTVSESARVSRLSESMLVSPTPNQREWVNCPTPNHSLWIANYNDSKTWTTSKELILESGTDFIQYNPVVWTDIQNKLINLHSIRPCPDLK